MEITMLEQINTAIAETPIPIPLIAEEVVASVGQVPSSNTSTGSVSYTHLQGSQDPPDPFPGRARRVHDTEIRPIGLREMCIRDSCGSNYRVGHGVSRFPSEEETETAA